MLVCVLVYMPYWPLPQKLRSGVVADRQCRHRRLFAWLTAPYTQRVPSLKHQPHDHWPVWCGLYIYIYSSEWSAQLPLQLFASVKCVSISPSQQQVDQFRSWSSSGNSSRSTSCKLFNSTKFHCRRIQWINRTGWPCPGRSQHILLSRWITGKGTYAKVEPPHLWMFLRCSMQASVIFSSNSIVWW